MSGADSEPVRSKADELRERLGEEGMKNFLREATKDRMPDADGNWSVKEGLPTEMTIDGVVYEVLGDLRRHNMSLVDCAKMLRACSSADEGQNLLDHESEIPASFRDEVSFVFVDWTYPDVPGHCYSVDWNEEDGVWKKAPLILFLDCPSYYRLLRRK